jgi:hypothetical protein
VSPLKRRHCAAAVSIALSVLGFAAASQSRAAAAPDPAIHDERLEASYNSSSEFIQYPVLDHYLAQVVRRIQDANPDAASIAIRIHALNYALPYAFVLGSGAAYVSTGLIARLDNESQLAAVIAMPLAALVRHDNDKLSADQRQRATQPRAQYSIDCGDGRIRRTLPGEIKSPGKRRRPEPATGCFRHGRTSMARECRIRTERSACRAASFARPAVG